MFKNLIKVLFPAALVFCAYFFAGAIFGTGVLIVVLVYMFFKYLPDIYVITAKYNYMKNNARMFELLEKSYKTGKMKPDQKTYYGYMCMREGRLDKAEQMFNAVLAYKQEPDVMARARLNYALLLWKTGRMEEALELTELVFSTYKSTVVYGNYGYLLLESGNLQKALEINTQGYEYNSTNDVICDNLAQNYYLLGEYEKSRKICEEIMSREPKFPIPYYNYAKTLYALGEKQQALEKLKKALEYPFSGVAAVSREEVEAMLLRIENELSPRIDA